MKRNLKLEKKIKRLNRIGGFIAPETKTIEILESVEVKNEDIELNTDTIKKEIIMEKLILNQPDRVTNKGKVESVVISDTLPLNENPIDVSIATKDILITEDPMDGIQIILND